MPHMQHAGTIFYVGVCVRTATTNQMVSTRPEAEVLSTRVHLKNTRTHITYVSGTRIHTQCTQNLLVHLCIFQYIQ